MKNAWLFGSLAVTLLGCEDPLKPAQRLDEPRVLGARLSNERGEASLVPGEATRAELLLAGPSGPTPAFAAYRICEASDSQRGVPACAGDAFAEGVVNVEDGPIAFDVPASLEAGARVALLGAACVDGEPSLAEVPLDDDCSAGSEPLRFSFDAWAQADAPHLNPDLAELSVTLGGNSVALVGAEVAPACDEGVPRLEAGQSHALEIELGADAFTGKELQMSHFSSRGELERQYSFTAPGAGAPVRMSWQSPPEAGPVKQYLVVRDGLGGVSWVTWNVCVR